MHIRAVKEPWRHSNRNNALGQMLVTNQRLNQLAAARTDFEGRGMLSGTCLGAALEALGESYSCYSSFVIVILRWLGLLVTLTTTLAPLNSTDEWELAPAMNDTRQNASILDENPHDEIVNDNHINILAEVKLSSTIRMLSSLSLYFPDLSGLV
jgi:hypothetical protein